MDLFYRGNIDYLGLNGMLIGAYPNMDSYKKGNNVKKDVKILDISLSGDTMTFGFTKYPVVSWGWQNRQWYQVWLLAGCHWRFLVWHQHYFLWACPHCGFCWAIHQLCSTRYIYYTHWLRGGWNLLDTFLPWWTMLSDFATLHVKNIWPFIFLTWFGFLFLSTLNNKICIILTVY